MKTLKPFQITAVNFLSSRRHALLADEMGLGKTLSAINAVNLMLPYRVLVVCPASIKMQWKTEIEKEGFLWNTNIQLVVGRKANIWGDVVIVNYDLLTEPFIMNQLMAQVWHVAIYDEVHYCKSMDAKRTKAVFGRYGLVHKCYHNILLTGTPILNRPIELYPMLKVLAPEILGKENTYEKFGIKFCKGWFDGYELNVQGSSNEKELNKRLHEAGFMLRRTEKEVELQLPKKRFQVFVLDSAASVTRQLHSLEKADFKKQRFDTVAPIATIRREVAEKKLDKSLPMIKDIVDQVGKIVIFAYHKSVIDRLMAEFKAVKIDGSCSQKERVAALKMFKEIPEVKVLIGQITAAGQGLDGMQDVCSHVLFLEFSYVPAEVTQAIARVHRMGQTKSVLVQFLVWGKSVEEHMIRTIIDKQETIDRILE